MNFGSWDISENQILIIYDLFESRPRCSICLRLCEYCTWLILVALGYKITKPVDVFLIFTLSLHQGLPQRLSLAHIAAVQDVGVLV